MSNVAEGLLSVEQAQLVTQAHHVLRSGTLEIDPVCRVLQRGREELRASPKVSCLVFHLATHCNRAVSKEELVQVLWPGVTVAETSFRWLLKEARRCLGDDGENQRYIETVRGYGLRWNCGIAIVACSRAPVIETMLASARCYTPRRPGHKTSP